MNIFPIAQLPPSAWQWDLPGTALSGGQPGSGVPQTADASGGGWWTCALSAAMLSTVEEHLAWRSTVAQLKRAAGKIVLPAIDACQPWPGGVVGAGAGRFTAVMPFSADGIFATDTINAVLAADAFAPAWPDPATPPTQAQIHVITGVAIRPGMLFSLTGDSGLPHMHLIDDLLDSVAGVYTVTFLPPLRENYGSGLRVELDSPMCTMKRDPADNSTILPAGGPGFASQPSIRFVEALS